MTTTPQEAYAYLIISGRKAPLMLVGATLITDLRKSIVSFLKATSEPMAISEETGRPLHRNWFEIDEFCVTFLDWVRICPCPNPECAGKIARDGLVDFLSDTCIEQTVMLVEGMITQREYTMYQKLINLLDIGFSWQDARIRVQKEMAMLIVTNADQIIRQSN